MTETTVDLDMINRELIHFDFVGYGEQICENTEASDRLYLDVGNSLKPGVIDHHHLSAYTGSTASLILAHPDFVTEAVNPDRQPKEPFTIVLHVNPDLDCLISTYLAITCLETGGFFEIVQSLAFYNDKVDGGYIGLTQENPYSLYSAYMQWLNRLSAYSWSSDAEMWRQWLQGGLKIVAYVCQKVEKDGLSIPEIDAFECPGMFGPRDRNDIKEDLARYQLKLEDAACRARRVFLKLPSLYGGEKKVETLIVRNVQNTSDPERCIFFKDWARTDPRNSANGEGFTALCVSESNGLNRSIISIKPDSGVTLRGLGKVLDQMESAEREKQFGVDDRKIDPQTGTPRMNRHGYDNSDPWYDGRSHGYTIVDAPRSGTLLSCDRIEDIFTQYGSENTARATSEVIPAIGHNEAVRSKDDDLKRLSMTVDAWKQKHSFNDQCHHIEIFISYSRKCMDWVTRNVYEPLAAWRGEDRIFFDKKSIEGGAGWLATIANAVSRCRVFLPVYSAAYFNSIYCDWELQLAVVRDPTGRKHIVIPVMIEAVGCPNYCSLIQCIDLINKKESSKVIINALEPILIQ